MGEEVVHALEHVYRLPSLSQSAGRREMGSDDRCRTLQGQEAMVRNSTARLRGQWSNRPTHDVIRDLKQQQQQREDAGRGRFR